MSKRKAIPLPNNIRTQVAPEQVLTAFHIAIDENNKCVCPAHDDTEPSMQVNKSYVYCFGCKASFDSFALAQFLITKQRGRPASFRETITWFMDNPLPTKSDRKYAAGSHYRGAVPEAFIDYYTECMDAQRYATLYKERLITEDTARRYRIGWRPDWEAWAIPFYRDGLGTSLVDILQFRLVNSPTNKRYLGMEHHTRGSVMNSFLLSKPLPYLLVLFGSFDAILAYQDGINAVGLNGSSPFKSSEMDRVKALFKNQPNIFIIPDNSPAELECAHTLARVINAQVRTFPADLPVGTDYIDYRKMDHTALDFMQYVARIEPINQPDDNLVTNLIELLKVGDPYGLAERHLQLSGRGLIAADVACAIIKRGPISPFTPLGWANVSNRLWKVGETEGLIATLRHIASLARQIKESAW